MHNYDNRQSLTLGEMKEWLKWNSIFDYNIVQSSLTKELKSKNVRQDTYEFIYMNLYTITVTIRGQLFSLTQMKNKDIYWELIGNEEIQGSAINK